MKRNVLLALIIWAISRDMMDKPIMLVLKYFMYEVSMSKRPAEKFADIIIADAVTDITKCGISYGKYDKQILNY